MPGAIELISAWEGYYLARLDGAKKRSMLVCLAIWEGTKAIPRENGNNVMAREGSAVRWGIVFEWEWNERMGQLKRGYGVSVWRQSHAWKGIGKTKGDLLSIF